MSKDSSFEITEEETRKEDAIRIGVLLKETREKKQLSIATVAQSLRLNEEYIIALEEERYDDLPAAPYVRVYLKALATLLGLNPEPLLQSYAEYKGASFISTDNERRDTLTINIQEEQPKNHTFYIVLVAIFLIVLVALISNTPDPDQTSKKPVVEEPMDTTEKLEIDESTEVEKDTIIDDSLGLGAMVEPLAGWEFKLEVVKDSTWIYLYEDGRRVKKGPVKYPYSVTLRPVDSINVKIGKIQNVKLYRQGKELSSSGKNLLALRITEKSVSSIPKRMWDKSFGAQN